MKKENQSLISKFQATQSTTTVDVEVHQENGDNVPDTTVGNGQNADQSIDSTTVSSSIVNANSDLNNAEAPSVSENFESNAIDTSVSKTQQVITENNVIPSVSEPMKKLEIRFKETMERVAELTDEKQRLEHLVLQLQGETETIGK